MKKLLIGLFVATLAIVIVFAQGPSGSSHTWRKYNKPYDPKTSPPLELAEAYQIALTYMGAATNRFYCVSASCVEKTRGGPPGWTIIFLNTNAQHIRLEVYFDKDIGTDDEKLIRGK